MRFISRMGTVYRLSDKMFTKLMQHGADGQIAGNLKQVYGAEEVARQVTDITHHDVDDFLQELTALSAVEHGTH